MNFYITLLVAITLMEMMFAMGLRLDFTGLANSIAGNPGLVARAVFLNYLIIPGLTLVMLWFFSPPLFVSAGFLILAVCPGAPYGPPFTAIARGNLNFSIGLMIILAGSSAIFAPLLLHLLLSLISHEKLVLEIDLYKLISTLFLVQLVPLGLGLSVKQWKPAFAEKIEKSAGHVSILLNFLMVATMGATHYQYLSGADLSGLGSMLVLFAMSMIAGWMSGWPGKVNRRTVSILTSLRNMSLGMVIVVGSFPGTSAVITVLSFAVVTGLGLLLVTLIWRQNELDREA